MTNKRLKEIINEFYDQELKNDKKKIKKATNSNNKINK